MAKILVIDDDPDIVKIVKMVLEESGHKIETSSSAEDAIANLKYNEPDLIFLDIQMPGKGGLAVANELAKRNIPVPFILCTGSILDDPVEASELYQIRHLYAGTLKKPMELADITTIAEKGLELGKKLKTPKS